MAFLRVGENWPDLRWQEFSPNLSDTVRNAYRIDGGEWNYLDPLDNTFAGAVDANADGLNRHTANVPATGAMVGSNVEMMIQDATEDDQYVIYGPYDVISDVATSAVVSPSSATVRVNRTQQFTVVFYAADGLATENHDPATWITSASGAEQGAIDNSTGVFTAGTAPGGPYVVTMAAGAVTDDAAVTVLPAIVSSGVGGLNASLGLML